MKYTPDGIEGRCQCVRDHGTLIDGSIGQCGIQQGRGSKLINGLCKGCFTAHGEMLRLKHDDEIRREANA